MGAPEISQFLTWLAVDRRVSASTQNQALAGLLFLYKAVLNVEIGSVPAVVRARTPDRLPVVLSRDEIGALLKQLTGTERLIVKLLYGSGSGWRNVSSFGSRTSISIATRSSCGKGRARRIG
jgi:site-specific recombinase XerD